MLAVSSLPLVWGLGGLRGDVWGARCLFAMSPVGGGLAASPPWDPPWGQPEDKGCLGEDSRTAPLALWPGSGLRVT